MAAVAGVIGYGVEQAVRRIATHARISRLVAEIIAQSDQENDRKAALRIGCLVLFNALAFHDRLAAVNETVPTVLECAQKQTRDSRLVGLNRAWRQICETIDYVPVFDLAVNILGRVDISAQPDKGRHKMPEPQISAGPTSQTA